nr:MAG TPA: regulatory protein/DNA complex-sensing repressor [Caudoviricetes sp.]
MPEEWTGELIGKMHNNRVTYDDVAKEMGVTKCYVSMILNGRRKPPDIQRRMEDAVSAAIRRRKENT